MTREEQIKQASLNENNYILADNEVDCISFQDGARWADTHSQQDCDYYAKFRGELKKQLKTNNKPQSYGEKDKN